jgi:hypothetical protein
MAITVADTSPVSENVAGRLHFKTVQITGDTSYPTNGYAFAPSAVGLTQFVFVGFSDSSALGMQATYDYANQKIKLFWCAGAGASMTEVTNGTTTATLVLRMLLVGA